MNKGNQVKKRNGRLEPINLDKINKCSERACCGIENVSYSEVVLDASIQLYDKISTREIDKALIMSARSKIEKEPNYTYVAARMLLNNLYKEVFGETVDSDTCELQYKKSFIQNIKKLVKAGRLSGKLLSYDLKFLSEHISIERDSLFKYLGIQTLYDRYFIHIDQRRMEAPQAFWMRVAMGLCLNEKNKEEAVIELYDKLSNFKYCPSTPTLFNSGTKRSQLSSCYLSTVDDSIDGIFGTIHGQARLSKYAGGLGVDWTPIRSSGSYIEGTNGKSSGLVPWLKIFNDTLVAVNQGGKRKGAGCSYLEVWHLDIEDFLELRKNTGDDRRRCHDMNTAVWVCDEFMEAIIEEKEWYLFDPAECPELHETYGEEFSNKYSEYCEKADEGKLNSFRKIGAKELWKKILTALYETGHPWITLYNEGALVDKGETAVCNLASINLANHLKVRSVDWKELSKTVEVAVRGLDNVIDLNFYPTKEAENSNTKSRPIGLGIMGTHDMLHSLNIPYDSKEAVEMCGKVQEFVSYCAIKTSCLLAKEKSSYPVFGGSEWDKGNLPIDTYCRLMNSRKGTKKYKATDFETVDGWDELRALISKYGMRNSNVMAIAPTATISYIQGCSQSIEPDYSILYVYSTLSGEFTMINEHFVKAAKKKGIWCEELVEALKRVDGDISALSLEEDIQKEFKTAFDVDYRIIIEAVAERQKWIDMGQSLNLYNKYDSLKHMNDIYMYAWEKGLKTTYYLRGKAATRLEKSTVDSTPNACSILDPDCESCQ